MRTRWALSIVFLTAACGGGGTGNPGNPGGGGGGGAETCTLDAATATTAVSMSNTAYAPPCIKVPRNATVTFANEDAMAHTVTTDLGQPETFDSGAIAPGASFTHVFTTAGTDHLHCRFHPGMNLTVFVQ